MSDTAHALLAPERRRRSRLAASELEVQLRIKGRWRGQRVEAIDFNRHGIALAMPLQVAKDTEVRLTLRMGERRVDDVIGVVHNCIEHGSGYRCGIQFRTGSAGQLDRQAVEYALYLIESALDA